MRVGNNVESLDGLIRMSTFDIATELITFPLTYCIWKIMETVQAAQLDLREKLVSDLEAEEQE